MRTMLARTMGALGAAVLSSVLVAPPALATDANPGGATVINFDFCIDEGSGTFVCLSGRDVLHAVLTPSGVGHEMQLSSTDTTISSNGVIWSSGSTTIKTHSISAQGESVISTFSLRSTGTGNGFTCTFIIRVHEANGSVQYSDRTGTCVPTV